MARRGGKNRKNGYRPNRCNGVPNNYVQSADLNQLLFSYYRNMITQMAMSRFRWINLPKTCDARYLEMMLLLEGQATIAFPAKMPGTFMSLKVAGNGRPNLYGNPSNWIALGDNGTRFQCNNNNGVILYDNETRYPLMNGIDLYARELAHLRMTKRVNRMHQMMPFILKGPQEQRQVMNAMFRSVANGEPAIIATSAIDAIDIEALQTGVTYYGRELAEDETNVLNQVYAMLGMSNPTYKAERQTSDEIRTQREPNMFMRMNYLYERRVAAEKINERFGKYLEAPIHVVWNNDNESENWNLVHNVRDMYEIGE